MNFLAHCLIAARVCPGDPGMHSGLVAGAVLGDLVKGTIPSDWPEPLQAGIRLHRRIDAYSNGLAGVRASCNRFPPELRRLAPVFVDIIADHCLAIDWRQRHDEPLEEFSQRCYATLTPHAHRLEGAARHYLRWLVEEDLLASYKGGEAMQRGLLSVTRRLRREHLNEPLLEFVSGALPEFKVDFHAYFPHLVAHGREWAATNLPEPGAARSQS